MQKATRQQTKDHNTRLVLKTIFDQGQLSRADIARYTGLTRPTVSSIVSDLLLDEFVVETGTGPSAGGKPPTFLALNESARQLICLDLSGAEFRGALLDLQGTIRYRAVVPATDYHGESAVNAAAVLVETLQSAASSPVLGIGIGTPGLVDPGQGIVLRAVNLGWIDLPLRARFEDRFGLPVHVANDSHLAAFAEYTYGPNRESANLIVIRIGQGIGAGIVIGGRPYYGDGFGAGEIGHVVVAADGLPCSCGNHGCLETTSSTRAMVRRASTLLGRTIDDWSAFASAVQTGNEGAKAVATEAGQDVGIALAHLVGGLNITRIVLAGRVADLGDVFLEPIRAEMRRRVLPAMADQTDVAYSSLGGDIVLLGGSALLLQRELGIV